MHGLTDRVSSPRACLCDCAHRALPRRLDLWSPPDGREQGKVTECPGPRAPSLPPTPCRTSRAGCACSSTARPRRRRRSSRPWRDGGTSPMSRSIICTRPVPHRLWIPSTGPRFLSVSLFAGAAGSRRDRTGPGRFRAGLPLRHSETVRVQEPFALDVALLQLSPPDRHGYCTLGTSVDAALAAAQSRHARRG